MKRFSTIVFSITLVITIHTHLLSNEKDATDKYTTPYNRCEIATLGVSIPVSVAVIALSVPAVGIIASGIAIITMVKHAHQEDKIIYENKRNGSMLPLNKFK